MRVVLFDLMPVFGRPFDEDAIVCEATRISRSEAWAGAEGERMYVRVDNGSDLLIGDSDLPQRVLVYRCRRGFSWKPHDLQCPPAFRLKLASTSSGMLARLPVTMSNRCSEAPHAGKESV